jgi:hypothetical protein
VPVEIWHIKAAGKKNWGRMPEIIAKIEGAWLRSGSPPIRMLTPPGKFDVGHHSALGA